MRDYHYLVSSLGDPRIDGERIAIDRKQLFLFCMEEMDEADRELVRRLFLFSDIKNVVYLYFHKKARQEDYVSPSYYAESEYLENLKDTSLFFPFLARFYENKKNGHKEYADLPETDEVCAYFYEDIGAYIPKGFLRDWYLFELELRNFRNALGMLKAGIPVAGRLIPFGTAYERASRLVQPAATGAGGVSSVGRESSGLDAFSDLDGEFPWLESLREAMRADDLTGLEMCIERIRWDWLDERLGSDFFSVDAVLSHFIRMESVERWEDLDSSRGKAFFDGLLNTITRSIRFSVEFGATGEAAK